MVMYKELEEWAPLPVAQANTIGSSNAIDVPGDDQLTGEREEMAQEAAVSGSIGSRNGCI
jgi:hypothetical protein